MFCPDLYISTIDNCYNNVLRELAIYHPKKSKAKKIIIVYISKILKTFISYSNFCKINTADMLRKENQEILFEGTNTTK